MHEVHATGVASRWIMLSSIRRHHFRAGLVNSLRGIWRLDSLIVNSFCRCDALKYGIVFFNGDAVDFGSRLYFRFNVDVA
jgi:hypothetical protein